MTDTIRIGDALIPRWEPGEYTEWEGTVLCDAGERLLYDDRREGFRFDGRLLGMLELQAMSVAKRIGLRALAANWIKEFERYLDQKLEADDGG